MFKCSFLWIKVSLFDLVIHLVVVLLIFCIHPFFTVLHAMQTRSSDENSVRPSVRLSIRHTVDCDKMVERSVQIYIPYERTFILVFWEEEWLVGGDPFYVKFWVNRPPLERNCQFSTQNAKRPISIKKCTSLEESLLQSLFVWKLSSAKLWKLSGTNL